MVEVELSTIGWLIGAAIGLVIGLALLLASVAVLWLVTKLRPVIDYSKKLVAQNKEALGLEVVDGKVTIDLHTEGSPEVPDKDKKKESDG